MNEFTKRIQHIQVGQIWIATKDITWTEIWGIIHNPDFNYVHYSEGTPIRIHRLGENFLDPRWQGNPYLTIQEEGEFGPLQTFRAEVLLKHFTLQGESNEK